MMALLDSIFREFYKSQPSLLASKILAFGKEALNLSLSLSLFRDILFCLHQHESKLSYVSDYLRSLEALVETDPPEPGGEVSLEPKEECSIFNRLTQTPSL